MLISPGMPYDPLPDLATLSLDDIAALVAARRLPPIDQWAPTREADSRMHITAEGRWYHDGDPITRPAMVRAFASLLRREADGRFALVTPVERQWIEVEDAPFLAVEMLSEGGGTGRVLAFRLNTDELVIADARHPLVMRGTREAPRPYLTVRPGIEARLTRSLFYDLVDLALGDEADQDLTGLAVWSSGTRFALDPETPA